MFTKEEIITKTNTFMVEQLEYLESTLQPQARLKQDIGMTSLDALETTIFIKRTFGFQPQRTDIKTLQTLGDLYDYIEKNII